MKELFEHAAFIRPIEDLPLCGAHATRGKYAWSRGDEFLRQHATFSATCASWS
jgi:hypothetical protein